MKFQDPFSRIGQLELCIFLFLYTIALSVSTFKGLFTNFVYIPNRVVPDADFEAGFRIPDNPVKKKAGSGYLAKYVGLLKEYYFLPP